MVQEIIRNVETGETTIIELEGEALAAHEALLGSVVVAEKVSAFAGQEDADRLRIINERARTDPAFAALADYVLRGVQRP